MLHHDKQETSITDNLEFQKNFNQTNNDGLTIFAELKLNCCQSEAQQRQLENELNVTTGAEIILCTDEIDKINYEIQSQNVQNEIANESTSQTLYKRVRVNASKLIKKIC